MIKVALLHGLGVLVGGPAGGGGGACVVATTGSWVGWLAATVCATAVLTRSCGLSVGTAGACGCGAPMEMVHASVVKMTRLVVSNIR